VAFGSVAAIETGRAIRREMRGARPAFFAIPGIDGLPDPCTRNLESWRDALPSVVICDPTVAQDAAPGAALRAAVLTLMRCIESYLGAAYNPPADGMALDGLSRAIAALPQLAGQASDLHTRRELMAASLNAAMAQEKGVGPTHLLSRALAAEIRDPVAADAARLILPGIVAASARHSRKLDTLSRVIGSGGRDIQTSLHDALSGLPMRARLSELGLSENHLKRAARAVAGRDDISPSAAEAVLARAW
ncbi:MAG: iron-containing alcohol dehydrogenase, partial [Pseudooceanicola sp.]|nr:iron-containing alcohol dehydrogenase [Pseudooceanicola sp.]